LNKFGGVYISITMNFCNSQVTGFSKFNPYWIFSLKDFRLLVGNGDFVFAARYQLYSEEFPTTKG
jgi:hypothetical protein